MLPSVAICGTARNAGLGLVATLKAIDKIREASVMSCAVIVTNDNEDNSNQVLSQWSASSPNSFVIACDGLARSIPNRIDRLAAARNMYLQALREQSATYEILVALDMDGPNVELTAESIANALAGAPRNWAAMFANQSVAYYDLFALRRANWVEGDVWSEFRSADSSAVNRYARLLGEMLDSRIGPVLRRRNLRKFVWDRQYRIDPSHPPIAVDSAFGGLGLYRYDVAVSARYDSRLPSGEVVCEHVLFNRSVALSGGGLYICPPLLNIAPDECLGPGSGAPFPRYLS